MSKNIKITKIWSNIIYAFAAQGITFVLSLIISLIVPKILGIEDFSYWQLFVFYTSYVGFFHFGLNDGIYLQIGGADYEKLNYKLIGSQFWLAFMFHCILALLIIIYSISFVQDPNRRYVYIATAVYLPFFNAIGFIGFIFQAVNKTKIYSISVIIDKIWSISLLIILLINKCDNFILFICLDLSGKVLSFIYYVFIGKNIIFVRISNIKGTIKEIYANVSIGVSLMLSNVASLLILGSGRFIVDNKWGIEYFGKFSFSLTLATFLLSFIAQISMVLFPALRQIDVTQQKKFYWASRELLSLILLGLLLTYLPIYYSLSLWLPQYKESLRYLIFLLPLCVFDGKMNLLCVTYFKVLRMEKKLLKINLFSLGIGLVFGGISGYLIGNIYAVLISSVIAVAFKSTISELYLSKLMGGRIYKNLIQEFLLVFIFVIGTWFMGPVMGFFVYLVSYGLFVIISKTSLAQTKLMK